MLQNLFILLELGKAAKKMNIERPTSFHQGKSNESVKSLRARFEGVLSKAFKLLQKDIQLRQELSSSRETLWKMLLDPVQFAKR